MIVGRRIALPRRLEPQLATLVTRAPEGDGWLHELKLDGYRLLGRIDQGRVTLFTRNGEDWTARFPAVAKALAQLRVNDAWLDGEVVVLDGHDVSSFQLLQEALSSGRDEDLLYFAFDLLYVDGVDIRGAPLEQRKSALKALFPSGRTPIHFLAATAGQGPAVLAHACARGFEGIVSKRCDAPYRDGRGHDWVKTKCVMRQEFVIGGFTDSDKGLDFGALLLGVHDAAGNLTYAGRVGTGFTAESRRALRSRLIGLERKNAPFSSPPTGRDARGVHWVKPELVAEVAFTNRTRDGRLRPPAFQGLREDKRPRQVVDEYPIRRGSTRRRP